MKSDGTGEHVPGTWKTSAHMVVPSTVTQDRPSATRSMAPGPQGSDNSEASEVSCGNTNL